MTATPTAAAARAAESRMDDGTTEIARKRHTDAKEFVFLDNYVTVLSSPIWWTAFGVTMFITVIGAFLELVFGMLLAIVMHRTIVGRGLVRTSALVPYGIVTVVAAFSWRFAW